MRPARSTARTVCLDSAMSSELATDHHADLRATAPRRQLRSTALGQSQLGPRDGKRATVGVLGSVLTHRKDVTAEPLQRIVQVDRAGAQGLEQVPCGLDT